MKSPNVTTTERAALIAHRLHVGQRLDTATVATVGDCSRRTAQRLLSQLSRVMPLTFDNGQWYLIDLDAD